MPGIDRLVPLAPVTFAAVATGVVALAVAGIFLYAAPKFALLARLALRGRGADAEGDAPPSRIAENAGGVVYWLVVFGAPLADAVADRVAGGDEAADGDGAAGDEAGAKSDETSEADAEGDA